ncbi:hypothetical protein AGMMS49992_15880 [Clostridia bacterium]|nr:hypothetical protein AGMMS49992_15880 [Clostridia bacterium]
MHNKCHIITKAIVIIIIILCAAPNYVNAGITANINDAYDYMITLFIEGDYEACAKQCSLILETWMSVIDQKDTINYNQYCIGMIDIDNQHYAEAYKKFLVLPSEFHDSGKLASYSLARVKDAEGIYDGYTSALSLYELCEGILDTTARKIYCYEQLEKLNNPQSRYNGAIKFFENGEFDAALMLFSDLDNYQDSKKYTYYIQGMKSLQDDDFDSALSLFGLLSDRKFLNSEQLYIYTEARIEEQNGNWYQSYQLYKKVDVLDSIERQYNISKYHSPLLTPSPVSQAVNTPTPIIISNLAAQQPLPRLPIPVEAIGTVTILMVTKNGANIREKPDAGATQVGYVPMYTSYLALSKASNGWYEILLATGVRGYVSGKLVDFSSSTSSKNYSSFIGNVTANSAKVRTYAAPTFDSDFMGSIVSGRSYVCVDINVAGEWYAIVTHQSNSGDWVVYVHKDSASFSFN